MMMFSIAMPKSKATNYKGNGYHSDLKINVVKEIDTKQWYSCYEQRQQCAMDSACNCC